MDLESTQLALRLQLGEVNAILDILRPGTDEAEAFMAMAKDLFRKLQDIESQRVGLQLLRTEHANRVAFTRLIQEEKRAIEDHELARRLAGMGPSNSVDKARALYTGPQPFRPAAPDRDSRHEDLDLYCDGDGNLPGDKAPTDDQVICIACYEQHPKVDAVQLPCKLSGETETHCYCRECLSELFQASLTDARLFPPRCCGSPIPILACMYYLPAELITRYEEKAEEVSASNPVYCSKPQCSKFIRPANIHAGIAACATCGWKTCATCKGNSHYGLCPQDDTVQKLLATAGRSGWQTCYHCKTMVELSEGCYHMTCLCGKEFCYLCAAVWKSCKCPNWDERNILADGEAGVAALDAPALGADDPLLNGCAHNWGRYNRWWRDREYNTICHRCQRGPVRLARRCWNCHLVVCHTCLYNR